VCQSGVIARVRVRVSVRVVVTLLVRGLVRARQRMLNIRRCCSERYSCGFTVRLGYVLRSWNLYLFRKYKFSLTYRLRPYHVEHAGSRLITEAKQRRAWLVLGWVTAWEHRVL
jgi:hypothetical protein